MTGSSRLAEARPVRNPANSLRSTSSAPSMRRRRSLMMGSSLIAPLSLADDRETPLARHHVGKAAVGVDREHQNRNAVFARQRDGGGIHHLKVAREHIEIGEPLKTFGSPVLVRICAVDAVDLGRLQ